MGSQRERKGPGFREEGVVSLSSIGKKDRGGHGKILKRREPLTSTSAKPKMSTLENTLENQGGSQ